MSEDTKPYNVTVDKSVGDEPEHSAIAAHAPVENQSMSVHPGQMINALISTLSTKPDIDFDKVIANASGLFELQKRYDDEMARKAFHAARAKFAGMVPTIMNDGNVDFASRSGDRTQYTFSTLAGSMEKIRGALQECRLTPNWKLEELDKETIKVTCLITHELGYQEETSLSAPRGAGVGATGMNVLQGVKSTISYLERITFFALLGLASKGDDDDGVGSSPPAGGQMEYVTPEQAASLEALFTEVGGDKKPIFDYFHADAWEQIPASAFLIVLERLEARRNA